uniref:Integrase catalytic domain-containing protein n=1 Tax=Gallus gallus TaxID=9031 RepID=A0A8V0YA94_CHICK
MTFHPLFYIIISCLIHIHRTTDCTPPTSNSLVVHIEHPHLSASPTKWSQQWEQNNWQRRGKPIWSAELWKDIAARIKNMVANALWGWLQQWEQNNWQRRGKPIWSAELWKDIAARIKNMVVKVRHVDAHMPKSRATEEQKNNHHVDQAAKIEVAQIDLDWQNKGELFLARWAHETSGHQGRGATYKWARDRGVDLTMDAIAQVIHDCETCAIIKQAKRMKPLWEEGRWQKYKYGEAWQIDYITLPRSCNGKRYVLTMVEATTGWLETYAVPHATARNTILGLEKQVLWQHGTPERIESDNGTHFKNSLINT